jgi:hypothetical protein
MKDYKIVVRKYNLEGRVFSKDIEVSIPIYLNENIFISEDRDSSNIYGGDAFDSFDETIKEKKEFKPKSEIPLNFLYDSNTLIDIKKYIYSKLNIPIESQYLECSKYNDTFESMDFKYKYRSKEDLSYLDFHVEISNIFDSIEYISDYPVDLYLFSNRDSYIIKSDSYCSISDFKNKNNFSKGKDIIINLYDINQIIKNKEEISSIISKDSERYNMFYYGFVEKFFPMIPKLNLIEFLKNKNLFKSFKKLEFENQIISEKVRDLSHLNSSKIINLTKSVKKNLSSEYIRNMTFTHKTNETYNIKKLFNSVSLSKEIIKVDAFLYSKKVYIERIFKNSKSVISKRKLEDVNNFEDKSFLIIFIPQLLRDVKTDSFHTITIYSNGLILSNCINEVNEWTKKNISSYYFSKILPILNKNLPYLNIETNLFKNNSKEKSISSSMIYNYSSNYNILKNITNVFKQYETLENFKLSQSETLKENIMIMVSYRKRNYFKIKNDNNDFYHLLSEGDDESKTFTTNSNITIVPRINDIRVDYNNIESKSYESFVELFSRIFSICVNNNSVKNIIDINKVKRIKFLKENDPILFNIDKQSKYSRLCQSEQQPLVISKDEIKSKTMDKKKIDYVKFWNFTRGETEYYGCDSKKYPYMKFLTNNHPKNYCLPCCKKKQVETDDDSVSVYKQKHESCLSKDTNFSYDPKSKKDVNNNSINRYISIYSCKTTVDDGRLMKISGTLKKFLDNKKLNLFIHGIGNDIFDNCQSLKIISMILFGETDKFINVYFELIKFLEENEYIYNSVVNGELKLFFKNSVEFISFLYEITDPSFISDKLNVKNFIDWNLLFLEIFCIFEKNKKIIILNEESNENINDSIITVEFIGGEYISSEDELIFLVKRKIENINYVYPIISIDTNKFYSDNSIDKILFNKKDYAFNNMIEYLNIERSSIYNSELKTLEEIALNQLLSIEKIYKNSNDYICSAMVSIDNLRVIIDLNPTKIWNIKNISKFKISKYEDLFEDIKTLDGNKTIKELIKKISMAFNNSLDKKENIRCLIFKNKTIGIWLSDFYIYINSLEIDFDYYCENTIINPYIRYNDSVNNVSELEEKNAIYLANSYNLLLLHLNKLLNTVKNDKIRKQIEIEVNKLLKSDKISKDVDIFLNRLNIILADYKQSKYLIMTKFINQKVNLKFIKDFLSYFNDTHFDFDKDTINSILINDKKTKEDGIEYLDKLLKDIVVVTDLNKEANIDLDFSKCNSYDKNFYCDGDRLIIPSFLYKEYLNILYDDLTNEFKKKYILNYNEVKTLNLNLTNYTNSNIIIHRLS